LIYNVQQTVNLFVGKMISETYHRSPTLDPSDFKKGLYLYHISGAKGLIEEGKIIKE
jgi:hypothetical protein